MKQLSLGRHGDSAGSRPEFHKKPDENKPFCNWVALTLTRGSVAENKEP